MIGLEGCNTYDDLCAEVMQKTNMPGVFLAVVNDEGAWSFSAQFSEPDAIEVLPKVLQVAVDKILKQTATLQNKKAKPK